MGLTVLSSLPSRGGAASRACASRLRLNPACIGSSAAASTNAIEPKRPGSCSDGEPPTKRRRVGEDAGSAPAKAMSLEEKNRINRLLLSLLPPGRSPNEVIPLPDSIVRVLQENGTRFHVGEDDEIEIDVHALSDDALCVIKDRVGAYLQDRATRGEAPEQSKEGVIGQSAPRSVPSKAAPKSIPPKAVSKSILSKAASKSILSNTTPKSIPSKAAPEGILQKAVPASILPRPAPVTIPPRPATKTIPLRAVYSPPAPPMPSESRRSVSEDVETAISKSLPRSTPPTASPSLRHHPYHQETSP